VEKARLDLERDEAQLDAQWKDAMADAGYRAEMMLIQREFSAADAESARHIE
jgi:hypothetical protein